MRSRSSSSPPSPPRRSRCTRISAEGARDSTDQTGEPSRRIRVFSEEEIGGSDSGAGGHLPTWPAWMSRTAAEVGGTTVGGGARRPRFSGDGKEKWRVGCVIGWIAYTGLVLIRADTGPEVSLSFSEFFMLSILYFIFHQYYYYKSIFY